MRLKLLFISLLVSCGILNAQDSINYLVISEARMDAQDYAYIEITNMGDSALNLSDFEYGRISPWSPKYPAWEPEYTYDKFRLPDHELAPGESYVIACIYDWNYEQYYLDIAKYEYSPRGRNVIKPEMWKLADIQVHVPESPNNDPTDSISPDAYGWRSFAMWGGRDCAYLRQFISPTDSVVIDQVGGMWELDGRNYDRPSSVAGVTDATNTTILVRKFSVKNGNLDFYNARGQDPAESEWLPVPRLVGGGWEPGRAVFWTVGNHGNYVLDENTLVSETVDVDWANMEITVPWGVRRDDSIMYQFERKPGVAWHYDYHNDTTNAETIAQSHADSAFVSIRTGDILTIYVCGNTLGVAEFKLVVSDPAADANIVIPLKGLQLNGSYEGSGPLYRVSDGVPGMDTISEVPYATRVDTLLKYLEKAPHASWEFVWVDGVERADLKKGDILRVTSENGTEKDYYIKVQRYRKSTNAYLASITWPDIPEDWRDFYGWIQDTIPNFVPGGFQYKIQVPYDVDMPAFLAKTQDVNATLEVSRAVNLAGSPGDKTITFTSTAEDDTTVYVYTVMLDKMKDPMDIQPWPGVEPFISEFIFWEMWSNGYVEICNPGPEPLDLSNYMFWGMWSGDPYEALTWFNEPDAWMNRYVKYVPGLKWVDSASWRVTPAKLVQDLAVNPIVQPGDVFVMSSIWTDWGIYGTDYENNWPAVTQADVLFHYPGKTNTWGEEPDAVGETCVRQWTGACFYMYKIVGDSVREGWKPATDPEDFELIETFGNADLSGWDPGGVWFDMITSCIRKPEYYLPRPGHEESYGTDVESSEWLIRDQAWYESHGEGWPMYILRIVEDLGKHNMNEVTVYKSTVASTMYKVSSGYTMEEEIRGVVEGTTVDEFLANVIPANTAQGLTVKSGGVAITGTDVVTDGDVLEVISADSSNTSAYVLDVTVGGLSNDAVLTSAEYEITVNDAEGVVAGMAYGTTLAEVIANVEVPVNALMVAVDANDAYMPLVKLNFDTLYVDVQVSDQIFLEVTAENGTTKITYQLQPATLASDAFVTSDLFPVEQDAALITLVPQGIEVSILLANVYPATGATMVLVDKNGMERTNGGIYRDDKLIVTSEDGSATKVYYLQMLPANKNDLLLHLAYVVSDVYEVDQLAMTISDLFKTTVAEFSGNLTPALGASFIVVDAEGNENTGTLNLVGDQVIVTAEDGVTMVTYTVEVSTIGVNDPNVSPLKIYPNPSTGILNVSGLERGNRIRVYNSIGVGLIDVIANQNHEVISLEGHPAGIYFVTVNRTDSSVSRYKVVLK
jgi:hypothetical protein